MFFLLATAAPLHAGPLLTVDLDAPWVVAHEAEDHVNLRYGDSAEGVRVQLVATADWAVGVTPIHGGRPAQFARSPMVQPPTDPLEVHVLSEGPDLVVRMSGPPLATLAERADAPEDPVLTWVRLRPRGDDWRIVLDGLGTLTLTGTRSHWTGDGLVVGTSAVLSTTATSTRSRLASGSWVLSTTPSIEHADPYPRTAWTWTP